jgi:hypothetical protein
MLRVCCVHDSDGNSRKRPKCLLALHRLEKRDHANRPGYNLCGSREENDRKMAADIALIRSGNTAAVASKLRLLTLDSIDRRCRASRRVRDLIAALEAEAGGAGTLSASDKQLIQRAAITGAVLEDLEAKMIAGDESVDPLVLATLGNTQRRALEAVGLKRAPTAASLDEDTLIAAASGKAA